MNPNDKNKPLLTFLEQAVDRDLPTFERNLLIALIHDQQFFHRIKKSACTFDGRTLLHRADFATARYNVLYAAIYRYWQIVGHRSHPQPIRRGMLVAILIDWANNGLQDVATVRELVTEIHDDFYTITLEPAMAEAIKGEMFTRWLQTRLAKSAALEIANHVRNFHADFTDIDAILREAKKTASIATVEANVAKNLTDIICDTANDASELIKKRFLCRFGALLLVGPTGIGKSSLAMQFAVCWAINRSVFGIEPAGALKSLIIQAENDDGDIVEQRDGIIAGLQLAADQVTQVGANVLILREDVRRGQDFLDQVLRPLLEQHRPDLVWIDPALAFMGGENNSQKDVGNFLRNGINPLLREFNCAAVICHHTNKPASNKDSADINGSDFAYLGAGSAEWSNWARAIITLKNLKGSNSIFELRAAKRGGRLGWKSQDGSTAYLKHIAHSKTPGQIFWREAELKELPADVADLTDEEVVLSIVPGSEPVLKNDVLATCVERAVPDKRARDAVDTLTGQGVLKETSRKRPGGGRDMIYLERVSTPAAGSNGQPVIELNSTEVVVINTENESE